MKNEWVVVVEPMKEHEAEQAIQAWMTEQAVHGKSYNSDEIRRDVILSKNRETLVRYMVQL